MKKFIDIFKNMRSIIKILQMVSEILTAVAEIYNKYFPGEPETVEPGKGE